MRTSRSPVLVKLFFLAIEPKYPITVKTFPLWRPSSVKVLFRYSVTNYRFRRDWKNTSTENGLHSWCRTCGRSFSRADHGSVARNNNSISTVVSRISSHLLRCGALQPNWYSWSLLVTLSSIQYWHRVLGK